MTVDELREILPRAWSQETSASDAAFNPGNPALGQCAVTALVVQDYLGGEIVNTIATLPTSRVAVSHYFNVIDDEEVDLTRQQFTSGVTFSMPRPKTEGFGSTREYILSSPNTVNRYNILKAKLAELLGDS